MEKEKENDKNKKKPAVPGKGKSNASKIQFLLDQRKPPTEKLQGLCQQYDDNLDEIENNWMRNSIQYSN